MTDYTTMILGTVPPGADSAERRDWCMKAMEVITNLILERCKARSDGDSNIKSDADEGLQILFGYAHHHLDTAVHDENVTLN
jgi:hypothetical protein